METWSSWELFGFSALGELVRPALFLLATRSATAAIRPTHATAAPTPTPMASVLLLLLRVAEVPFWALLVDEEEVEEDDDVGVGVVGLVGLVVGLVGMDPGLEVGAAVGAVVGLDVGTVVGRAVGLAVGIVVGAAVGPEVGVGVGVVGEGGVGIRTSINEPSLSFSEGG